MRLAMILLLSSLVGCNAVSFLSIASYDTNEYKLITVIRTSSQIYVKDCGNSVVSKTNFNKLYHQSLEFKNYTQYLKKNADTYKLATNLHELITQSTELYSTEDTVSQSFCELNLEQITNTAASIQETTGDKPK